MQFSDHRICRDAFSLENHNKKNCNFILFFLNTKNHFHLFSWLESHSSHIVLQIFFFVPFGLLVSDSMYECNFFLHICLVVATAANNKPKVETFSLESSSNNMRYGMCVQKKKIYLHLLHHPIHASH